MEMEVPSTETQTIRNEKDASDANKPEPEPIPKIQFNCANCPFSEQCEYKGRQPPFANKVKFLEECYVMQDPFSPPPGKLSDKSSSEYFIVLGADCSSCGRTVCAAGTCSIFYGKSFCLQCAYRMVKDFPLEIQSKIRKLVAAANDAG